MNITRQGVGKDPLPTVERLHRLKSRLHSSWLYPRHIGEIYLRRALSEAREYAHGTLLDVGCGLRPYQRIFEGIVDNYIGLDFPVTPDQARPNVVGDALNMPVGSSKIDTILAIELLEHVDNPDIFFEECARVLRASGCLILSAPFLEPLHEQPRDYYRFTPYGLTALLLRHGFSKCKLWPRGGWWSVVLGSFAVQSLYDFVNPIGKNGYRRYNKVGTLLILPWCVLFQLLGYVMDKLTKGERYTLGYLLVATRA